MKASYRWLRELIDFPYSAEELAFRLTMSGTEVKALDEIHDDCIFELEITPNRPDCYGHWGLAREISAIMRVPWEPQLKQPNRKSDGDGGVIIKVETQACPRYIGRLIEGVKVKQSPEWLAKRLSNLGIRPISNIVDITNYLMLLTGQPMHAFDADKLGRTVIIRQAIDGEPIKTLDGIERKLDETIMVIADENKPVAIAGIMGGIGTEIDENTKNVFLEVAYFDPVSIRRARKKLEISTESSTRFERGTDPNILPVVSDMSCAMMEEIADASKIYGPVDIYQTPIKPILVTLTEAKLKNLLGVTIPREDTKKILVCLGLNIKAANSDSVIYEIPTYRPDITREVDLVEEVARIYGFDKIPEDIRAKGEMPAKKPDDFKFINFIENVIAGLAFQQVMTDPLVPMKVARIFAEDKLVELANPLSEDYCVLRPNPLPTAISVCARNLNRGFEGVRIFEIGQGYCYIDDKISEPIYLVIVAGGQNAPVHWSGRTHKTDIYDIYGALENFAERLNIQIEYKNIDISFAEKGTGASILADGENIGFAGQLGKDIWNIFELKQPVFFAVVKIGKILKYFVANKKVKPFSRFPSVRRDIALIVDESILGGEVLNFAKEIAPDAEKMGFFDVYRGKPVPDGKKSLGMYFVFGATDRTLTDEEVNTKFFEIVQKMCEKFKAKIRE